MIKFADHHPVRRTAKRVWLPDPARALVSARGFAIGKLGFSEQSVLGYRLLLQQGTAS